MWVDPTSKELSWTPPIYHCSECGAPLYITGDTFRPPSRRAIDQWSKAELLIRRGFLFHKHVGPYPKTLSEAREFVRQYKTLQDFMNTKQLAKMRKTSNKTP